MIYVLFLSLLFTSNAFADFQNDLPENFPVPSNNKSTPAPSQQQSTPPVKQKKFSQPPSSPIQNKNKTKNPSQPANSSASTNQNEGSFSSELGNHDNNAPVFFSGKHGDGSRTTGILNLVGDVVIIQDDTILKSNKAQIFSNPGSVPTPGTSKIQRALATGNVRVMKKATPSAPEIKATGDETEFLVPDRILILKGKAKVWRTDEYINGDVIKVSLNSGDVDIVRPEGTIDPKTENKAFGQSSGN